MNQYPSQAFYPEQSMQGIPMQGMQGMPVQGMQGMPVQGIPVQGMQGMPVQSMQEMPIQEMPMQVMPMQEMQQDSLMTSQLDTSNMNQGLQVESTLSESQISEKKGISNFKIFIIFLLLIMLGGIIYYFMSSDNTIEQSTSPEIDCNSLLTTFGPWSDCKDCKMTRKRNLSNIVDGSASCSDIKLDETTVCPIPECNNNLDCKKVETTMSPTWSPCDCQTNKKTNYSFFENPHRSL